MNKLLAQLSAAGLVLLAGCGDSGAPAPGTGTGVDLVLIVIDTLRADAVLDPEGRYDTPNLDRLARDGIVFPLSLIHI